MAFWRRQKPGGDALQTPLKSNRSTSDSLSAITHSGDLDAQKRCKGCKRIQYLLEWKKRYTILPPQPVDFHNTYADLDKCALKCVTCRVFRQALLLEDVTTDHVNVLQHKGGAVSAQLEPSPDDGGFAIRIRVRDDSRPQRASEDGQKTSKEEVYIASAVVRCSSNWSSKEESQYPPMRLAKDPSDPAIYCEVRAWLLKCERNIDCGNLAYSDRRPTRLLRILSDSHVQLVDSSRLEDEAGQPPKPSPRYAALSYCWGFEPAEQTGADGELSAEEAKTVQAAKTLRTNLENRYQPFNIKTLPATVRDAVTITWNLNGDGLDLLYLWVDTLCIIQDDADDKAIEIQRMQEVYGNATVTICATATAKATQPLLSETRLAWSNTVERCRIGASWLTVSPTPLAKLRSRSPLALRGWTLQEEHLSPRRLFWSGQQLSWACGCGEYVERGASYSSRSSVPASTAATLPLSSSPLPRHFLVTCREPKDETELCLAWHDMVESYTARGLSELSDRFNALAGLATRYLDAMSGDNEYMAGLWQATFAQDLLWRVARPATTTTTALPPSSDTAAPSWSWASLPIGLAVVMSRKVEMRAKMDLLRDPEIREAQAAAAAGSSDAVARGASVHRICVKAPLRKLWGSKSQRCAWQDVHAPFHDCGSSGATNDKFRFADPSKAVHAADSSTARLMAYEAHKRETVAELDYVETAVAIAEGRLEDVYCLAISEQDMLLLSCRPCPTPGMAEGLTMGAGLFQRIGVAFGYRRDFFKKHEEPAIVDIE
ncbi:HET-domain-containing protein [Colletotrichum tofieldiae]|uniref:HET-domain-containing protein n=1 Tax=Colletotrichum tofieldiae TaxID=708197 RepID=A0A166UVK3_9PEZI|nr:HET-domain-containing protein [Colletotrichum tofieldiae]GKT89208.1 HET-domain-containing protein [Colletotrichum tofieldiae]